MPPKNARVFVLAGIPILILQFFYSYHLATTLAKQVNNVDENAAAVGSDERTIRGAPDSLTKQEEPAEQQQLGLNGRKVVESASITEDYADKYNMATTPDPTLKTVGYFPNSFYSGFRNEAMAFTKFVMDATDEGFSQILLPTLKWKDLFGTDRPIPHQLLFDVVHWNTYYPKLPKLVRHHPEFVHYNGRNWVVADPETNATLPYARGRQGKLIVHYRGYTKRVENNAESRHSAEILMLQGALRPHPELQSHMQMLQAGNMEWGSRSNSSGSSTANNSRDDDDDAEGSILYIHARVEPDMQNHNMCKDMKVRSLKNLIADVYLQYPKPPASRVFFGIARDLLEKEVNDFRSNNNTLAVENLELLNRLRQSGMWGEQQHDGRVVAAAVKVYEGGAPALANTTFRRYPSISGSILNYFLALEADIFIGTPVSSWSTDVIAARFYRGRIHNYWYKPNGIENATSIGDLVPPRFYC